MPARDAIIVGAGHNGLVAAAMLARTGRRVLVLERAAQVGGAAVSAVPFAGLDARISRYAYLVSLFPRQLREALGIEVELRPRSISSYTPSGDSGVLVCADQQRTRASIIRVLGSDREAEALARFRRITGAVGGPAFATLTEPLRSRFSFRGRVADEAAWVALFERPLSELLESSFESDLMAGMVATDALIGTFAATDDAELRQNRCFLYHVIGNGTGRWDVPVGGMGNLSTGLARAARLAGAEFCLDAPVTAIAGDERRLEVTTADGRRFGARHLLANVAPSVLAHLLGEPLRGPAPEGSQLKLNLLLRRLPRIRDDAVTSEEAFAGTFHVNESYAQLRGAYNEAAAGRIPRLPPCEAYCHSLADPSILGLSLRKLGAHTLTVFALHLPARLFRDDHDAAKRTAIQATLDSLNSVLAEPIENCLMHDRNGELCLEAHTPIELEAELGLPGGHIFHQDLTWPFAEAERDVGRWGVETSHPNVWICGAGARRGGGVSGIPGHNAARAVIEADASYRG